MSAGRFARWRGHAVVGALFSLVIKVGGSVSALAMFALASWTLDSAAFGDLVIVFNIVSLAAVAAVLGQDTLIQRSWGEYVEKDPERARGAVVFGVVVTLLGAATAALAFVGWASIDGRLTALQTAVVTGFLVSQTLLHFTANLARVVCGARRSEPPRELFWRLPLVVGLGTAAATGGHASIVTFFAVASIAQFLGIGHLAVTIAAALPASIRAARARPSTREWIRRSATMTSAAISEAAHQYADVILIGHVLGSSSAAGYFVVMRIANIFSMLTSGIHTYSASKVSQLYFVGRLAELRRLISQIMLLTLVLVTLLFAAIAFEGPALLSVFGAQYRDLHAELVMMSLVTCYATLAGPGPLLMLTMGADLLYLKLIVIALGIRIAGLLVLAPMFELRGAILAVALAVVPLVTITTILCIRRLGVDPSVLAVPRGEGWFGPRRQGE